MMSPFEMSGAAISLFDQIIARPLAAGSRCCTSREKLKDWQKQL
jgi:hypothetical protein